MPFLINGIEVDIQSPTADRSYRGAWMLDGEVVRIDPAKAAEIAYRRIKDTATEKRREIDAGKADANDLKGALALNANDDSRPKERDDARALLTTYGSARGETWQQAAASIIAARTNWAGRVIAIETLEAAAWRALDQATTADQVAEIERQITEAIRGV